MPEESIYRLLFDSIDDGFCIIEVLFGDDGEAIDYRFLKTNKAFERQTGIKNSIDKTIKETEPRHEEHWLRIYGDIVKTGEAKRFTERAILINGWYDVYAFRIGGNESNQVGVIFKDVTERKRAEEALKWRQEKDELLAGITSQLLSATDVQPIIDDLALRTMNFLKCDVFFNYMVDKERGGITLNAYAGVPEQEAEKMRHLSYGVAVCGRVAQGGKRIIVRDILNNDDERTPFLKAQSVQTYACHPLLAGGKVIGTLSFGTKSKPQFIDEELSVMKEVSDHISIAMQRLLEERALAESEFKYRTLFNSMTEAVAIEELIYDKNDEVRDYYFRDVNPTWEKMFGKTRQEAVGKTARELFGVVEDYWIAVFKRVAETGNPEVIEQYSEAIDGYFNVNAWKMGEKVVAIGVIDVTESRRAQRWVEEQRARLQAILDSAPIGIFIGDEAGRGVLMNDSFYRIWGANAPTPESAEEYREYKGWFAESGKEVMPEEWAGSRALKGETVSDVIDIQRFDGRRGTIIISAVPLRSANGSIVGNVVAVQDITQLRMTEENLKRSNEELRQFAYVASHDLQEPLRMVSSYIGLLDRKYGRSLDGQAKEYMNFILQGSDRMRQLIEDLLEYSRVDTRGKELAPTNMNEVMERTLVALKASIDESRAIIEVDHLPTVPADEGQMIQLMQNLIGNAIKFRRDESPKIKISCLSDQKRWMFEVKDNGIGIDPQYSEKIFEVFQRLNSSEKYQGTGIGLAIAKKIVERHGGRIWVESDGKSGSTFCFTIPKR